MRVLSLVTKPYATFYWNQTNLLEELGVDVTTLNPVATRTDESRSVLDYLRVYPTALRESFGSYDLVHANYGLTAPLALAQPNLPVVLSLWGTDLMGRFGPVSKFCANRCDAVVVMTEEMASLVDRDCYVVPHGVDTDLFEPMPQADAQSTLEWDPDTYHVFFPYSPEQGVKDYPRAERVVNAVDDLLDRPVVLHSTNTIPYERMPVYMNAADALLLTSKREGSPNTVKEALACNLPVVSTDVGDVATRLDGVSPAAVGRTDEELVDGLASVLESNERCDGREAIMPLSARNSAKRLQSIYESVLAA